MEIEYGIFIELGTQIFVGLVIAVLTSTITVRLALKRFVSEKLWEKRAGAYGAILEALHDMKRFPDQILDSYEIGRDNIPAADRKRVLKKYKEGAYELNRRFEVEQFFLSDDLQTEISKLNKSRRGARENDDGYSVVDDSWDAIDTAQENIRAIAKAHLSVH